MYKNITVIVLAIFIFTACSSKQKDAEYNKPAVYWYNKMLDQISFDDLDGADDTYTSLESEHKHSTLVASANIIIAQAHMDSEEYELANYYFDEYLKKFVGSNNIEHIRYLKVKAKFLAFKQQFREQELLYDTIAETDDFIKQYPHSKYLYLVKTMKSRLLMARASFDKEIAMLYGRLDKPDGKKLYENKASHSWNDSKNVKKVTVPWYRRIFE